VAGLSLDLAMCNIERNYSGGDLAKAGSNSQQGEDDLVHKNSIRRMILNKQ
jgi:hypothetical protein